MYRGCTLKLRSGHRNWDPVQGTSESMGATWETACGHAAQQRRPCGQSRRRCSRNTLSALPNSPRQRWDLTLKAEKSALRPSRRD